MLGLILTLGAGTAAGPSGRVPAPGFDADVLIQAGHEGRPDCAREPATICRNTGTAGEIAWTPVVADEATRILSAAGVKVLRRPAYLSGQYRVRDAVFIHFDGSGRPCSSGASIGYPVRAQSPQAGAAWKALYKRFWPFGFEADNFTPTLAGYYGFNHVRAVTDAALVVEGGEMSCPKQHAWLQSRLKWEGALIAHFVSARIGKGNVPLPPAP